MRLARRGLQQLLLTLTLFLGVSSAQVYADQNADTAAASVAPVAAEATQPEQSPKLDQAKPVKTNPEITEPLRRSAAGGFSSGALSQLVLGLGLVVGVILLLAWLVKRMGYMAGLAHSGLKVVATLPLTARERLIVVQAGEQQLLLGVSPGRINLLQSFDEPIIDAPVTPQFAVKLKQAMHKVSEDKPS